MADAPLNQEGLPDDPDPENQRAEELRRRAAELKRDVRRTVESPVGMDRQAALGLVLPLQLAACIAVGTAMGHYIDVWLGTGRLVTVVFFILGGAAGVRQMLNTMKKMGG